MADNENLDKLNEIDMIVIYDDESDEEINNATKNTGHRSKKNVFENEHYLNSSHSSHCVDKPVLDFESKYINIKSNASHFVKEKDNTNSPTKIFDGMDMKDTMKQEQSIQYLWNIKPELLEPKHEGHPVFGTDPACLNDMNQEGKPVIKQEMDNKNTLKTESVFPLFDFNWDRNSVLSTKKEEILDKTSLNKQVVTYTKQLEHQLFHEKMLLTKQEELKQEPDATNEQRKQSDPQMSVASSSTKSDVTYTKQLEHVIFHDEMLKVKQEKVKSNSDVITEDSFNIYSVCDTAEK